MSKDYWTTRIPGRLNSRVFIYHGKKLLGWMDKEGEWKRSRTGLSFTNTTGRWIVTMLGKVIDTVDSTAEGLMMVVRLDELRKAGMK